MSPLASLQLRLRTLVVFAAVAPVVVWLLWPSIRAVIRERACDSQFSASWGSHMGATEPYVDPLAVGLSADANSISGTRQSIPE